MSFWRKLSWWALFGFVLLLAVSVWSGQRGHKHGLGRTRGAGSFHP